MLHSSLLSFQKTARLADKDKEAKHQQGGQKQRKTDLASPLLSFI